VTTKVPCCPNPQLSYCNDREYNGTITEAMRRNNALLQLRSTDITLVRLTFTSHVLMRMMSATRMLCFGVPRVQQRTARLLSRISITEDRQDANSHSPMTCISFFALSPPAPRLLYTVAPPPLRDGRGYPRPMARPRGRPGGRPHQGDRREQLQRRPSRQDRGGPADQNNPRGQPVQPCHWEPQRVTFAGERGGRRDGVVLQGAWYFLLCVFPARRPPWWERVQATRGESEEPWRKYTHTSRTYCKH
jgi:hypothetical protein